MNSSIFPDVNVWLALNHKIHVHHDRTMHWYVGLPEGMDFVFCRQTQTGLFRLLNTEVVMGRDVMTQRQCWKLYQCWIDGGKARLCMEPVGLEKAFRARTLCDTYSPKVWADAFLDAFGVRRPHACDL